MWLDKKGETAVHCCDPNLSVLAGVSKRFSRSISLAVYCLSSNIFFFLADQISCRSYVGSVYRMRSLAVYGFSSLQLIEVTFFFKLTADQVLIFDWMAGSCQVTLLKTGQDCSEAG